MDYDIDVGKASDRHGVGKAGLRKEVLQRKDQQSPVNCGGCRCDVCVWEAETASVAI